MSSLRGSKQPRRQKQDLLQTLLKDDPPTLLVRKCGDPEMGDGLFTNYQFNIGDYICQYRGETLTGKEADERKHYGFLFYFQHNGKTMCVDAFDKDMAGIARYANDDWVCPNARVVKECIGDKPYLFLKCIQPILPNKGWQEIRYDYNDPSAPWRCKNKMPDSSQQVPEFTPKVPELSPQVPGLSPRLAQVPGSSPQVPGSSPQVQELFTQVPVFKSPQAELMKLKPRRQKQDLLQTLLKDDPPTLLVRKCGDPEMGDGLFTNYQFNIGDYICQYRGETLTGKEADKRKHYGFLFYFQHNGKTMCVDAFDKDMAGIARYANDDWVCPNARVVKECIGDKPYLFLKCIQPILPNKGWQEIRYDYNDPSAPWRWKNKVPELSPKVPELSPQVPGSSPRLAQVPGSSPQVPGSSPQVQELFTQVPVIKSPQVPGLPSQMPGSSPQVPGSSPQVPVSSPYVPESYPYVPESSPYVPESSPCVPKSSPYVPESSPCVPESSPHVPESSPHVPESSPCVPESSPYVPESSPCVPESSPCVPESSPHVPESSPHVPESSSYVPVSSSYVPESSPYVPESSPFVPESSPYVPESSPYVPESSPHVPESSQQVSESSPPQVPGLPPHAPEWSPQVPEVFQKVPELSPKVSKSSSQVVLQVLDSSSQVPDSSPPQVPDLSPQVPVLFPQVPELFPQVPESSPPQVPHSQPGSPLSEYSVKGFVSSGLNKSERADLMKLVEQNDGKLYGEFNDSVTHVIMKTNPNGSRVCDRTLKYFQGMARNCWLMDYQWVLDSKSSGYLLPEEKYEIVGNDIKEDKHYGPKKSRESSGDLLKNFDIFCSELGAKTSLSVENVKDLIVEMKGTLTKEPADFSRHSCTSTQLVVSMLDLKDVAEIIFPQYRRIFNGWYRKFRVLTVSSDWLLDSLTMYTVQPLEEYVLTSKDVYQEEESCKEQNNSSDSKRKRELLDPVTGDLTLITDESEPEEQSVILTFDGELDGIQVQQVASGYKGKRDYSKKHCCYFCETKVMKMSRHLQQCHANEHEILKLPNLPKETDPSALAIQKERTKILDKLRNIGDFNHNVNVIVEKKGTIIVGKRRNVISSADEYLPCSFCYVFLLAKDLWRHAKCCSYKGQPMQCENSIQEERAEKQFMTISKLLLQGAKGQISSQVSNENFFDHVINSMLNDEISMAIRSDGFLLMFGEVQFQKLGQLRAGDVRSKLRIISRLKLVLRKLSGKQDASIEEFLSPEFFDTCIEAVKQLCVVSENQSLSGTISLEKPDLALKAGQLMKKLGHLKRGQALRKKNEEEKKNAEDFIDLYLSEWNDRVSANARQTIYERRFNKKDILPLTSDIVRLSEVLSKLVKKKAEELRQNPSRPIWNDLAKMALVQVTIFNKRRGEEASKMLLKTYDQRLSGESHNEEILSTLSKIEVQLLKRMQIVEVLGKQNRKVPVLLTPEMQDALKILKATREQVGIPSGNPYVFTRATESHLRGSECIREIAARSGLERPDLITSTRLRKYLATVAQVLTLSDGDLQEVARHMGHELNVHRQFYRRQEDVTELSKISKLLLVVEAGNAHKFAGKTLDDIQFEDLFGEDTEDETETTKEPGNVPVDVGIVNDTLSKRKRKRINYESENQDSGEDSGQEYMPDDDECEDEREADWISKGCKKKDPRKRTSWTNGEIQDLKINLLPIINETRKPPTKPEVDCMLEKCPELRNREWKAIKFRAWALYQQRQTKTKQLLKAGGAVLKK